MQKLLNFLIGKRHWFLFFVLEAMACTLLIQNHAYQRNVFFSSANSFAGHISSVSSGWSSYIGLRSENKTLFERNGNLELEVLRLQEEVEKMRIQTTSFDEVTNDATVQPYHFVTAKIVNNSVTKLSNYITIDKGQKDGVKPDMGVISTNGVVGVVSTVSKHFSVVIPILNPKLKISCKIAGEDHIGSLSWEGRDVTYATLRELPRHAEIKKGDLVVTSGFSALFPPGITVGKVEMSEKNRTDRDFSTVKVKLSTDFQALKMVRVVQYDLQEEKAALEKEATK